MGDIEQRLDALGSVQIFQPVRPTPTPAEPRTNDEQGSELVPIIDACYFEGKPIPPRDWFVDQLIPASTVTLMSGDGGTGKSLLALQLCAAAALNRPWLGMTVKAGRSLFFTAEDDKDEIHRRTADIVADEQVSFADLRGLSIAPMAGLDALLAVPDARGAMTETSLFRALEAKIAATEPALIVLDTLADVFGGDEIKRAQARQFIGMWRGLALKYSATVLLLMHPSLSGMNTGSGASGSTAWSNSVRSRLYLEHVKSDHGDEPDPDLRVLRTMKANYGRAGQSISLRWHHGVFRLAEQSGGTFERIASAAKAERIFLELLAAFTAEGRNVSATTGHGYAPTLFARDPRSKGLSKTALTGAMGKLFEKSRIRQETYGPPSRPARRIVPTEGAQ